MMKETREYCDLETEKLQNSAKDVIFTWENTADGEGVGSILRIPHGGPSPKIYNYFKDNELGLTLPKVVNPKTGWLWQINHIITKNNWNFCEKTPTY